MDVCLLCHQREPRPEVGLCTESAPGAVQARVHAHCWERATQPVQSLPAVMLATERTAYCRGDGSEPRTQVTEQRGWRRV